MPNYIIAPARAQQHATDTAVTTALFYQASVFLSLLQVMSEKKKTLITACSVDKFLCVKTRIIVNWSWSF